MFLLKQIEFYQKSDGSDDRFVYCFETTEVDGNENRLKASVKIVFTGERNWSCGKRYEIFDIFSVD